MDSGRRNTWIAVLGLTVIGALLRFGTLDRQRFWLDELVTVPFLRGYSDRCATRFPRARRRRISTTCSPGSGRGSSDSARSVCGLLRRSPGPRSCPCLRCRNRTRVPPEEGSREALCVPDVAPTAAPGDFRLVVAERKPTYTLFVFRAPGARQVATTELALLRLTDIQPGVLLERFRGERPRTGR